MVYEETGDVGIDYGKGIFREQFVRAHACTAVLARMGGHAMKYYYSSCSLVVHTDDFIGYFILNICGAGDATQLIICPPVRMPSTYIYSN